MPAKRSRLSIVVAILKALSRSETVCSRLCEEVNMPYDRLKTLLEYLEEKGLVRSEQRGRARVYKVTGEGMRALKRLEEAYAILKNLGLEK